MSRTVRALLIDGSAASRRLVREAVGASGEVRIVDSASCVAATTAEQWSDAIDVVIVGAETQAATNAAVADAHRLAPRTPVLVFGTSEGKRARAAAEALAAGATDYVEKPASSLEWRAAVAEARRVLVPRLVAIGNAATTMQILPAVDVRIRRVSGTELVPRPEVLVVGASTGGPEALATFFGAMPRLEVPTLLVQHMPASFVGSLASRLERTSVLSVREGTAGARLEPGVVYLAPGERHMRVAVEAGVSRLELDQSPPECSCRPAVDPLFRSAARSFGPRVLAVVLTGMGQDGLDGCRAIRSAGGKVLVQDEATSVVWGMPGQIARAGLADEVLPLGALAGAVVQRLGVRSTRNASGVAHET